MSADLQVTHAQQETVSPAESASASNDQAAAPPSAIPEWSFLVLSLVVILLSFLLSAPGEERVYFPGTSIPLPGLCVARSMMGLDCPGCGLTRCFISLSHGDFGRAWHFNPAGFLFYAVVAVQVPFRLAQIWRIRTGRDIFRSPIFGWVIAAVGVSLVLQWAVKMWLQLGA